MTRPKINKLAALALVNVALFGFNVVHLGVASAFGVLLAAALTMLAVGLLTKTEGADQ